MLITTLHTEDSGGIAVPWYAHRFIALTPNHRHPKTPKTIRDWLDLVYESVNNLETPNINRANKAISKAANLIDMNNLSSAEAEEKKKGESAKIKRELYEEMARKEGEEKVRKESIKKLPTNGISLELIAISFDLTVQAVQDILQ